MNKNFIINLKRKMLKNNIYKNQYSPELLQKISRKKNRILLKSNNSFSYGEDIWNLYEISWLQKNGFPQIAIGEIIVPFDTEYFIESKSLKLYLNSLNQTFFDNESDVSKVIQSDLTHCILHDIKVTLFPISYFSSKKINFFEGECLDDYNINIKNFEYNTNDLLNATEPVKIKNKTLFTNLFKANCPITNQPDWGSVQIIYSGNRIKKKNIIKYLFSFRKHREYHEQCAEIIFDDIKHFCKPNELFIYLRFVRRGGIDINIWRGTRSFAPINSRLARQ
ncbi:NADPH-dependent 7-cyano-7-deazaguanine reductase QueF [Candidatus Tachikawaea gelatinosa]|uniref:NADPH-dependent 7-cyano-7-deazaguanine reductase n=1 Tax=Candidatus Tachikawaea gelatinosa TaxID=1410383 RepID=A0A090AR70_9ENTR|nr:NADPH-dependent 7-cyano-7-deazaguanine reductase QueF [Candidatus Tachikawaea gelatinosa]BAP58877.1 NADPH-dependent 7-cyano-7-deazaguanine reductase [Candidatus Tachikawaea gelatinosa]